MWGFRPEDGAQTCQGRGGEENYHPDPIEHSGGNGSRYTHALAQCSLVASRPVPQICSGLVKKTSDAKFFGVQTPSGYGYRIDTILGLGLSSNASCKILVTLSCRSLTQAE